MPAALVFRSTATSVAWVVVVALVMSGAAIWASRKRGADRSSTVDHLVVIWLVAALGLVGALTLQPRASVSGSVRPTQFNPISSVDVPDAVGNMLLFLPVGFFAALFWRSRRHPVVWATGLAISVSLAVELAQWLLPISRVSGVHDVITNSLGGFLGAMAGIVGVRMARRFS